MSALDLLSWVIGLANPISAALVGPALAAALARRGASRWVVRAQGTGWLVLAVAQMTFLTFGYAAGFPGFQYAQPLMIPVAGLNFLVWLHMRRRSGPDRTEREPKTRGDPSVGLVNQPSNVLDQIRELRRELAEIRKAIGLTSATIQRGGLTLLNDAFLRMVDDNDIEILYAGPDNQGRQIVRLRREGGGEVLYTYTITNGQQYWALTDRTGRILVSDDAETGTGLARPWLPIHLFPLFYTSGTLGEDFAYANLPVANLAGETQLWEGRATLSHPKIEIDGLWGQASGVNTATYRLKVAGTTVGTWNTSALEVGRKGPFDIAAFIGQDFARVDVTASASGTGNIACQVLGCYLRQS